MLLLLLLLLLQSGTVTNICCTVEEVMSHICSCNKSV